LFASETAKTLTGSVPGSIWEAKITNLYNTDFKSRAYEWHTPRLILEVSQKKLYLNDIKKNFF